MSKKRRSRAFKENSQVIDMEEVRRDRNQKRKEATKKKNIKKIKTTVSGRRATKAVRNRLIYTGVFCFIAIFVVFTMYNFISLRAEEKVQVQRKEALIKEEARLEQELLQVDSDEYIEEQARTQLRMIKPGERIYILPEDDLNAEEVAADKEKSSGSKSVVPQQ